MTGILIDNDTGRPIHEGDVQEDNRGNKYRVSMINSTTRKVFLVPVDDEGEERENGRAMEYGPSIINAKFN